MVYEEFPEKDINQFLDYFIETIQNTLKAMVYRVPDIGPEVFAFAAVGDGTYDQIQMAFDTFPEKGIDRENLFINMGQGAYSEKPGKVVGVYQIIGAETGPNPKTAKEVLTITGSGIDGLRVFARADVIRVDGYISKLGEWDKYPSPQSKTIRTPLLDKFWSGYKLATSKKDASTIYGIMRGFSNDN